jgi:iron(III) transport system ATP-binding protein
VPLGLFHASKAGMTSPHIRIRGLFKRFGAFTALKSIDLDIAKGEFVCFLGPSGCGKTTLLRAIAGLDPQNEGSIEIAGRDVSHLPPAARDFGIVFQSYALFPNLTVADNVAYGLVNRRSARADRDARVAELLALVGLGDQGIKYPAQLSGGQQQRVALARALATSPGLLLLDEPLSALDARVRVRLRDEIKQLQRRLGVTTIMVTHDQEEALGMADRIVVMNHGTIDQVGTPQDVYARPATPFVADFVGQMTFFNGVMTDDGSAQVERFKIKLDGAQGLAGGTPVRLGIRPEDVQLHGMTPGTPNRIETRIASVDYLGAVWRLTLTALSAGVSITADISGHDLASLSLSEGQTIVVSLPPERLRVFPMGAA